MSAKNPWLSIALDAYEAHMALPTIGQAAAMSGVFSNLLHEYRPKSVALLGCSGGNGLVHVNPAITNRVVAVDINPDYVAATKRRYPNLPGLDLFVCDIERDPVPFQPVSLVFAALLLEYIDLNAAFNFIRLALEPRGTLAVIIQLPSDTIPEVTPSPYAASFVHLSSKMRLVDPHDLNRHAALAGLSQLNVETLTMPNLKRFQMHRFASA